VRRDERIEIGKIGGKKIKYLDLQIVDNKGKWKGKETRLRRRGEGVVSMLWFEQTNQAEMVLNQKGNS
jgi:glutamine synthetase